MYIDIFEKRIGTQPRPLPPPPPPKRLVFVSKKILIITDDPLLPTAMLYFLILLFSAIDTAYSVLFPGGYFFDLWQWFPFLTLHRRLSKRWRENAKKTTYVSERWSWCSSAHVLSIKSILSSLRHGVLPWSSIPWYELFFSNVNIRVQLVCLNYQFITLRLSAYVLVLEKVTMDWSVFLVAAFGRSSTQLMNLCSLCVWSCTTSK